ncbi:hypothetical protein [Solibacillus sp.]|uniref:hypothetical protein n=1 Tax=Solibacillus sp. TaxID=1909654 RepID=UPI003316085D
MNQNQIIKNLQAKSSFSILKEYKDSKLTLSSSDVVQKFYRTPGFNIQLFLVTKNWFDTNIMPNQKRGLNLQGYMRLIAM